MSDVQLEIASLEEFEPIDEIKVVDGMGMPNHPPLDPRMTHLRRWLDENGFEPLILIGNPMELLIGELMKRVYSMEIAINALMALQRPEGDNQDE